MSNNLHRHKCSCGKVITGMTEVEAEEKYQDHIEFFHPEVEEIPDEILVRLVTDPVLKSNPLPVSKLMPLLVEYRKVSLQM